MTSLWKQLAQQQELVTRPVMVRACKSSFTIRVDQMFTASDQPAFTNAQHRPVKTPDTA
jgi:hypothetical protein